VTTRTIARRPTIEWAIHHELYRHEGCLDMTPKIDLAKLEEFKKALDREINGPNRFREQLRRQIDGEQK